MQTVPSITWESLFFWLFLVFLSQPFFVAGQFTGLEGRYVPVSETIQGFKEIIEGKYDDIPESYFLNCGGIDDVLAKVEK